MTRDDRLLTVRKLSEKFAYTSIQMHECIGRKMGLTVTDHKYLGFLIQKGQMSAGELSVLTGLTTGAVTGLIDRFEKKKLVKRVVDRNDRRKVLIVPNAKKITSLFEPMYKDFRHNTEVLFASFLPSELDTIERYFGKAIEIMTDKIGTIAIKK